MRTRANNHAPSGFIGFMRRLRRNNKGVAAVEFALISPLLMLMFIGTLDMTNAWTVGRRIPLIANSVADLISRTDRVTDDELYFMSDKIARALMAPYDFPPLKINIMSIRADINDVNNTTVEWSRAYSGNDGDMTTTPPDHNTGASYPMPQGIMSAGSTLIVVEVTYDYVPIIFTTQMAQIIIGSFGGGGGSATAGAYEMKHVQYVSPREHVCVSLNNTNCVTGNPF